MNNTDTKRALLNSLSSIDHRNWDSSEKNNRAAELVKQIRSAIAREDRAKLLEMVDEVRHFVSPAFTLFERIERLVRDNAGNKWGKSQDDEMWKKLVDRARIVVQRRDSTELLMLSDRIVAFLRRQNRHNLAQSLEEAKKTTRRGGAR